MPSESRDQLRELLGTLVESTHDGLIRWENGAREDSFRVALVSGSVTIRSIDADGIQPFEVQVLNQDGRVIASATTVGGPASLDATIWNRLLSDAYTAARDSALDVTPTLRSLLEEARAGRQPSPLAPAADDDDIPF